MTVGRGLRSVRSGVRLLDDRRRGRSRLHFLHIPKTGGTAVKAAFGRADVVTPTHRLVLHGHGFGLADVPDGEHAVFVVRDPVSRFVSGFESRRRRGRPRYDVPWSPAESVAFASFPTADSLARALGDPTRCERAREAMGSIRHVNEPLTAYLGSADTVPLDRIARVGRLEALPALVDDLAELIGTGPVALPTDPVAAHRAPSRPTLSPLGKENVRRWYADDIELIAALRRSFFNL